MDQPPRRNGESVNAGVVAEGRNIVPIPGHSLTGAIRHCACLVLTASPHYLEPHDTKPTRKKTASPPAPRAMRASAPMWAASRRAWRGARFFGLALDRGQNAIELAAALGGLKGPIMKVAQLMATIPDALPPEYAAELTKLQSEAPPMGWAFVKRRMTAELGRRLAGEIRRRSSTTRPPRPRSARCIAPARTRATGARLQAAISRHAVGGRGRPAAARTGSSRSTAAWIRRSTPPRSPRRSARACARSSTTGARRSTSRSTARCSPSTDLIRVPQAVARAFDRPPAHARLARGRAAARAQGRCRSRSATGSRTAMFTAWWFPFSRFGVIHGDPHLGNYTVFDRRRRGRAASTCSTTAASASSRRSSSAAWSTSTTGLRNDDRDLVVHAYETWGFKRLVARADRRPQHLGALHLRAAAGRPRAQPRRRREARPNTAAAQAFEVHRALKEKGPVTVPREFVFMDRAAIGLGGVFLHLRAELNFYRLFNEAIEDFSIAEVDRAARTRRSRRPAWRADVVRAIDGR